MFAIGTMELVVIFLIAVLFAGPQRIPEVIKLFKSLRSKYLDSIKDLKEEVSFDELSSSIKEFQDMTDPKTILEGSSLEENEEK